ncbi:hypothetical protein N7467_006918 [Penicillium canescens]|nr:hypothetical protein N7467_006918 [Penicillium canescens]
MSNSLNNETFKYPALLEGDDPAYGAVCCAIKRKITSFIEAVLNSGRESPILEAMLYPVTGKEEDEHQIPNCVSIAIKERLDPKITLRLLQNVPVHSLAAQDQQVFTPLHHAVEASSSADAVEHVAKRNFDIISMSWSIKQDDDKKSNDGKSSTMRIKENLQTASQDALLFCSAPDIGRSEKYKDYCPFGADDLGSIFRIGAAKVEGTALRWSGNKASYILPGEEVSVRSDDRAFVENYESPRTGSSVVTALAAGLAALIIHCVRLGAIYITHEGQRGGVDAQTYDRVKNYDLMRKVFDNISDSGQFLRRVAVESYFKTESLLPTTNDLYGGFSTGDSKKKVLQNKWEAVAKLARDLVPYATEKSVGLS